MQFNSTSELTGDLGPCNLGSCNLGSCNLGQSGLSYGYLIEQVGFGEPLARPAKPLSIYPPRGNKANFFGLKAFRRRSLIGISLLTPVIYLTTHVSPNFSRYLGGADSASVTLSQVLAARTLTVATVRAPSTYFGQDGFEHGFGLDVMQGYATHLGVALNTVVFDDASDALAAVNAGQADIAMVNQLRLDNGPSSKNPSALVSLSVSCQATKIANGFGLGHQLSLQVPQTDGTLPANMTQYLCDQQVAQTHQQLADFYHPQTFDNAYSEQHFYETIAEALPAYRQAFVQNAKTYQLDWELLVAMGYQESHLDANAVSPTGVRGIMMLSTATAEELGVTNRVDPHQSIAGGAKYVSQIRKQFAGASPSDQVWFTLAAYNMGTQAIKDIQANLNALGRDGNRWAEVYRYMAEHRASNRRYEQCMTYVSHIRGYLETLKQQTKQAHLT